MSQRYGKRYHVKVVKVSIVLNWICSGVYLGLRLGLGHLFVQVCSLLVLIFILAASIEIRFSWKYQILLFITNHQYVCEDTRF